MQATLHLSLSLSTCCLLKCSDRSLSLSLTLLKLDLFTLKRLFTHSFSVHIWPPKSRIQRPGRLSRGQKTQCPRERQILSLFGHEVQVKRCQLLTFTDSYVLLMLYTSCPFNQLLCPFVAHQALHVSLSFATFPLSFASSLLFSWYFLFFSSPCHLACACEIIDAFSSHHVNPSQGDRSPDAKNDAALIDV